MHTLGVVSSEIMENFYPDEKAYSVGISGSHISMCMNSTLKDSRRGFEDVVNLVLVA